MLGGLLFCLPAVFSFRPSAAARFLSLTAALVLAIFAGLSSRNDTVNLSRYRDCRREYRLASAIREAADVPGRLVLNFRHYPANCLSFYAQRNFEDFRRFLRREMAPAGVRLAVFKGNDYGKIRGIEVRLLRREGDYHLLRLENTGGSPVRLRFE